MRRRKPCVAAVIAGMAVGLLAGCGPGDTLGAATNPYSRPGRLVRLEDGRGLNLRCAGHGTPTVLLEAGWGASSQAWEKVEPALARITRVCAYDRAGYGFSDPGPAPRDGAAIVRDLDQALAKAGEHAPFIFVGHSAGAFYGRLFAARHPRQVEGLVLLDPSVEEGSGQGSSDGLDGIRRRLDRCLAAAVAGSPPAPGDPQWAGCLPSRPTAHDLANAARPEVWRTERSELDNIFTRTSAQVSRIGSALRSIPIYVITASETAAASSIIGSDPPLSVLELRHQMIAASSRDGSQRTVVSSHLVMIDRPEVVIAAVSEMIRASRAGRLPAPLPPGETEQRPADETFQSPDASPFKSPFPEISEPAK